MSSISTVGMIDSVDGMVDSDLSGIASTETASSEELSSENVLLVTASPGTALDGSGESGDLAIRPVS